MAKLQKYINDLATNRKKQLAVLIDPDKVDATKLSVLISKINTATVDLVFVGGSLMVNSHFNSTIKTLKADLNCPVIIFPGHPMQISNAADAILLLSLISGRNADLLIGQHVHAAPLLKESGLEIMPTGYMLINGGQPTTVSYMSNTQPIPRDKPEIAACTALAGEMMGLKNIYLEAGSGAQSAIPTSLVSAVKNQLSIPLIVGGGIRDAATAKSICEAGADIIVVGTAIEGDMSIIESLANAVHSI